MTATCGSAKTRPPTGPRHRVGGWHNAGADADAWPPLLSPIVAHRIAELRRDLGVPILVLDVLEDGAAVVLITDDGDGLEVLIDPVNLPCAVVH